MFSYFILCGAEKVRFALEGQTKAKIQRNSFLGIIQQMLLNQILSCADELTFLAFMVFLSFMAFLAFITMFTAIYIPEKRV